MDWYNVINYKDLKIILYLLSIGQKKFMGHKQTLWGSFLIEYKNKKIFFACDTGYGNIYKELGKQFGPIDLTLINIGAHNFYPMSPRKDKSIYHTNPEEALKLVKI